MITFRIWRGEMGKKKEEWSDLANNVWLVISLLCICLKLAGNISWGWFLVLLLAITPFAAVVALVVSTIIAKVVVGLMRYESSPETRP